MTHFPEYHKSFILIAKMFGDTCSATVRNRVNDGEFAAKTQVPYV